MLDGYNHSDQSLPWLWDADFSWLTLTVSFLDLLVPVFKQKYGPIPWCDLPPEEGYHFGHLHAMPYFTSIILSVDSPQPPPGFRQGKPHTEQQHGRSIFTPTFLSGSCHSHVPSRFAFFCLWLLLPQKTCSTLLCPFLLAGQKADRWPVFGWTDKSAS